MKLDMSNWRNWAVLFSIVIIVIMIPINRWQKKELDRINLEIEEIRESKKESEKETLKILKFFQEEKEKYLKEEKENTQSSIDKLDKIIQVLVKIESNGNPKAIGDDGLAVGILQIHPITVKDVNRIIGKNRYSLKDRYCPKKSIEIAKIYLSHYTNQNWSANQIARVWNGGPKGHQKKATLNYERKFLKEWSRI